LTRFAKRLRDRIGARQVLLFGSQARGDDRPDSDYDLIIVSPSFDGIHPLDRGLSLRELFYEAGGYAPLDLICLTPDEFEQARHSISLVSAVLPEAVELLG
jgi:predicted nucleotidyltransferase